MRGSGLFVAETGISADHHFLVPDDGNAFRFTEGHYRLDVFAHLLSDASPIRLFSQASEISRDIATALEPKTAGLYFDWGRMHHATFHTLRNGHPPPTLKSFCGSWEKPRTGDFL